MDSKKKIGFKVGLFVLALGIGMFLGYNVDAVVAQGAHPEYGCDLCHVPHNALDDNAVPLWNPAHSYTTLENQYYDSPTMQADTTAGPDGASKLCLSCHDGSYFISSEHTFGDGKEMGPLSANHPISFVYDEQLVIDDGELVSVDDLPPGVLDVNNKVQCTSCHDVHATAADSDRLLRWPYDNVFGGGGPPQFNNAAFCRNCHLK